MPESMEEQLGETFYQQLPTSRWPLKRNAGKGAKNQRAPRAPPRHGQRRRRRRRRQRRPLSSGARDDRDARNTCRFLVACGVPCRVCLSKLETALPSMSLHPPLSEVQLPANTDATRPMPPCPPPNPGRASHSTRLFRLLACLPPSPNRSVRDTLPADIVLSINITTGGLAPPPLPST